MIQTNMTNAINTIRENYQSQIEEMVQKEMQRIQNIQVIVDEYMQSMATTIEQHTALCVC